MTTIDIHAHVIPPALVEAMRAGTAPDGIRIEERDGAPWVVHRQGTRYLLPDSFHVVETRLRAMDEAGIDIALLAIAPTLFLYGMAAEDARGAASFINDALAAMVAACPERFAGLATLPMQDPGAAVAELRRSVDELGMRGAQIGTTIDGLPLDDPSLRPVLEEAERLGVPLLIHPYGATTGLEDFFLGPLQGNPWQTAVAASRLILSGTLDWLPDLDVVLVHGGGHLPYQIGRLDHGHRVRPEAAAPRFAPSEYLRRFHFDTLTHSADVTRWLVEQVGADRVLFGTDMPSDMGEAAVTVQVPAGRYPAAEFADITHRNAETLFRLNGVRPPG